MFSSLYSNLLILDHIYVEHRNQLVVFSGIYQLSTSWIKSQHLHLTWIVVVEKPKADTIVERKDLDKSLIWNDSFPTVHNNIKKLLQDNVENNTTFSISRYKHNCRQMWTEVLWAIPSKGHIRKGRSWESCNIPLLDDTSI